MTKKAKDDNAKTAQDNQLRSTVFAPVGGIQKSSAHHGISAATVQAMIEAFEPSAGASDDRTKLFIPRGMC